MRSASCAHAVTPDATRSSRLPGFHKLTLSQRLAVLSERLGIPSAELEPLFTGHLLPTELAEHMVDHAIGRIDLPVGLALNLTVNGRDFLVPMAVEEPSVLAAVSFAARLARTGGGFAAESFVEDGRRFARATCRIAVSELGADGLAGVDVAEGIVQANRFALADPYRAATHNKGIMNGIGAAAMALGQDGRDIEAMAHAFASRSGHYRPMSQWTVEDTELVGRIEIPLATTLEPSLHPGVALARRIVCVQDAAELACVIAAVGLAQNLSAVRALGSVGIQRGHMAMHARSVAVTAGAREDEIAALAQALVDARDVKVSAAVRILETMRGATA